MSYIADLHLHSRFANATSPQLSIQNLALWGKIKGINLLATGDFTHPRYYQELRSALIFNETTGFFNISSSQQTSFALVTEVSCIYKDKDKSRKIHLLIVAPSFKVVDEINKFLSAFGNLASDGRPILLVSAKHIVKELAAISSDIEIIPAHIWTPWFGVLGQRFGYTSLEECFEEEMMHIHAIETGLSSDPQMNWYLFDQKMAIVSFSDAHSLHRLGREATIFEGECSYKGLLHAIRTNKIVYTIEFFPEEGKYHFSGHRKCFVSFPPEEARKMNNRCPICGRKLTEGVLKRVYDIAQNNKTLQEIEYINSNTTFQDGRYCFQDRAPFMKLISLDTLIALSLRVKGKESKKVQDLYQRIIQQYGNELSLLMNPPKRLADDYPKLFQNIIAVKEGNISITPGFDNTYGKVAIKGELITD